LAKIKPEAGSDSIPVLRPNWAGQLLLPLMMGAIELGQLFALGQALRLFDHLTMGVTGRLQVAKPVLALSLAERGVLA
jgi:hypothetical protein